MKKLVGIIAFIFSLFIVISAGWSFEIITEDDIRQEVIVTKHLLKTADNAIFLFDSSSSMDKPYKDTGMTRYDIAKKTVIERNNYFPDLGYNFGFYLYTPWKEIYPMQKYNRDKFAKALAALPEKATGPTMTTNGLKRLDSILKPLKGKTVVFLYTDGSDTNKGGGMRKPIDIAQALVKKYDVCFYVISTNDDYYSSDILKKAPELNICSRVIGFGKFIEYPAFNSEALFTVVAEKNFVTVTDKKIVGIKTRNILFDFNEVALIEEDLEGLSVLSSFLKNNPSTYTVIAGYTDNVGSQAYNMELSRHRVERVAYYLSTKFKIDSSRVLKFWYGKTNPVADNSNAEGRALNRRVEILIGKK